MNKTLVIMAAGMGSRYGGLKQIDSIGPNNEIMVDYSIFDAVNAGFNKVVFIIKEENYDIFKEVIGNRISDKIKVEYVFQKLANVPKEYTVPKDRVKPWGTGHAVLSCLGTVKEPFAVINADDFYGRESFIKISQWMDKTDFTARPLEFCMAGYILKNTLTKNGHVARGVCTVDHNGYLKNIVERVKIMRNNGKVQYTEDEKKWVNLPENSIVSMNCWGFSPLFLDGITKYFKEFLSCLTKNDLKTEFLLPAIVQDMIDKKLCTVKILNTKDSWFGVTYKEDKSFVVQSIKDKIEKGEYPLHLWQGE